MFKSDQREEMSLQDVLSELMKSDPPEYHEVRHVAEKIVHYFRRPAHEITIPSIMGGLRLFSLYLSFERLPLYLIDIVLKDADRVASATETIQNKIALEQQEVCHAGSRGVSAPGVGDQVVSGDDRQAFVTSGDGVDDLFAEGVQS